MTAAEILITVNQAGARLSVEAGTLTARPASRLSPELREAIMANKGDLVRLLAATPDEHTIELGSRRPARSGNEYLLAAIDRVATLYGSHDVPDTPEVATTERAINAAFAARDPAAIRAAVDDWERTYIDWLAASGDS